MSLYTIRRACRVSMMPSFIHGCVGMSRGAAASGLDSVREQLSFHLLGDTDAAARWIVRHAVL